MLRETALSRSHIGCKSSGELSIDENSSDQGRLFRASKRLLNFHVDRALPPHSDARMLANEMGEYFVHKITAIRSALDADASVR